MPKHTPKPEPERYISFEGMYLLRLEKATPDDGMEYVSDDTFWAMEQRYPRSIRRRPTIEEIRLVRRVLMDGHKESGGPLFRLARALKAEPWCKTAEHGFPHALLMADFAERYSKDIFMAGKGDTCAYDADSITLAFESAWDSVKYAEGENMISQALKNSEGSRLFSEVANRRTRRVIALAFELQRIRQNEPIILPQDRLGELLEMDQREVGLHIRKACKDGYLEKISDGDWQSQRAGTYRFIKSVKGTRTVNSRATAGRF